MTGKTEVLLHEMTLERNALLGETVALKAENERLRKITGSCPCCWNRRALRESMQRRMREAREAAE